jgi:hypothetical protein
MATLRIVGGDEGEQAIELRDGVLQIGRARDNDIVLAGAEKGVSRLHAELRFENGRFVIVDLQSQNGTWVNGKRVDRAEVPPGAEIALGEYRLSIVGEPPASRVAAPPRPVPQRDPMDEFRRETALTAPPIPMPPTPPPTAASRSLLPVAVVGAIVLCGVAAVWMLRPAQSAGPEAAATPAPSTPAPVAAATPALPSETPATDRPNGTEPSPDPVVPVTRPASASGAASAGAARVARKPGESLEAWRSRSDALQTRYGYSKAAMERGDFAAASGGFEAILLEEPGFLDTAQLLVQAQAGLRSNARSLHQAGTRLEASGDWVGALQKYEQARQIFSGIPGLPADVKRMKEKLRIAGTNAFTQAKAHESAGRLDDAVREYEKAVQWLPSDDPNRQIARSRVEQLKKH